MGLSSLIGRRVNPASLSCKSAAAQYLTARAQNSKTFVFPDELSLCRCRWPVQIVNRSPMIRQKMKENLSSDFTIQSDIPVKRNRNGFCRVLYLTKYSQLLILHAWKIACTRPDLIVFEIQFSQKKKMKSFACTGQARCHVKIG